MNGIWLKLQEVITNMSLPKMGPMDFVEIILIAVLVYNVIKWIKNTRAWVIVKGLIIILLCWFLATIFNFDVILWIFMNTIGVGITAVIIIFQPELRKVLEQLGTKRIVPFSMFNENKENVDAFSENTVNELVRGTFELARAKTGALIVIEQKVSLNDYVQTGILIDGIVTSQLLINIFEHNTPLHDGAVIVRGNRVVSATCYLPLSDNMRLSKELGTRHRAGVGISEATDSFTIIVSEQTGRVSIACGGNLSYNVDGDFLRSKLKELINEGEKEQKRFRLPQFFQRNKEGAKR